ncbi:hypothetical protein M378DRAFT_346548 [Amanita muscaria Koide BX008]|uniref:Protein kinase domain-containing protein n=1 Tax=Amanita muscaria (strain Koide BX008) TaxID=946122 RepID=A0A0C2SVD8_AMAMK|nr:hypothetical protein M378DRAFT_346548 [Amanita muscaria Koide BX008]
MYSVLRFDCVEIAKKVSSVLDAQNLVNLIDYMIHVQNSVKNGSMDFTCKEAINLVREIYARVPVLPDSIVRFVRNENSHISSWDLKDEDDDLEIENLCSRALMGRVLNHRFIFSYGPLILATHDRLFWDVGGNSFDMNLLDWPRTSNASHSTKRLQVMLELSKSIQYFHSVGVVICYHAHIRNIVLDPEFRPKLHISDLDIKGVKLKKYAYENSVFTFGRLFYEVQSRSMFVCIPII